jgi:hypothetical protein
MNDKPLSKRERARLAKLAATEFAPMELDIEPADLWKRQNPEYAFGMLHIALQLVSLTKPELAGKLAGIQDHLVHQIGRAEIEGEAPVDIRLAQSLKTTRDFFAEASRIIDSAVSRMLVVEAARVLEVL